MRRKLNQTWLRESIGKALLRHGVNHFRNSTVMAETIAICVIANLKYQGIINSDGEFNQCPPLGNRDTT